MGQSGNQASYGNDDPSSGRQGGLGGNDSSFNSSNSGRGNQTSGGFGGDDYSVSMHDCRLATTDIDISQSSNTGASDNFSAGNTGTGYGNDTTSSSYGNSAPGRDTSSSTNFGGSNTQSSYGGGTDNYDSSSNDKKNDSTAGKLMEKAGNMFGNDDLAEKGRAKRNEAGSGGYGGNDDSYGSSGNTDSYGGSNNNNNY